MKVLLITGSFPPMRCGVGDYTGHLAEALSAHGGVEVGVLTSRDAQANGESRDGIFPVVGVWAPRDFPKIMAVLRRWKPDVVHIQYPTQGYAGRRFASLLPVLCQLAGFRVVQTWHEYHLTRRPWLWFLAQLPVSGGVVVVRPRFLEQMAPLLRRTLRNKAWSFIPNASSIPAVTLTAADRESVRAKYGRAQAGLVVYFGFMYPKKGVERLFEIVDPSQQHLVIIGEVRESDDYHRAVLSQVSSPRWTGKTTLAGFLPAQEVARVIAAADAVVLPFTEGAGDWNTSLHAAQAQGTFVLTTSDAQHGYDADKNTYFARPEDVAGMRAALAQYVGRRSAVKPPREHTWQSIADAHLEVYRQVMVTPCRPH